MTTNILRLSAALLISLLAFACNTDMDIERYQYACDSSDECASGYRCAHMQDLDARVCVPPASVESCDDEGDEDGDGAADCDDIECAEHPDCDDTTPADADDDGIADADDNCPAQPNPQQEDADDDGVGDACDNCPQTSNTGQEDGDDDRVGNACDNCPQVVNPNQDPGTCTTTDSDNDGVADNIDNCPQHHNPEQRLHPEETHGMACSDELTLPMARMTLYEDDNVGNELWSGGVAVLGDLDDDGFDDIAIGTPATKGDVGGVTVLFSSQPPRQGISALASPSTFRLQPPNDDGFFGASVAAIGDLTEDGLSELAVGHPGFLGASNEAVGAVHIYYSQTLQQRSHSSDVTLPGVHDGDAAGDVVVGLSDIDGDDVPDVAVGAHKARLGGGDQQTGAVYVISGGNLPNMASLGNSAKIIYGIAETEFGKAIAAGDFDGDGLSDLALGAPGDGRGHVYVLYAQNLAGRAIQELSVENTDDVEVRITSNNAGGGFGASVALAGSIDGDHIDDLAIGAIWSQDPNQVPGVGSVHVIAGQDGIMLSGVLSVESYAAINIDGVQELQALGRSLAYVGDLNGDGRDDLVVGATDTGDMSQGAAYLLLGPYSGSRTPVTAVGVTIPGVNDFDNVGLKVSAAGSYAGGEFPGFFVYSPSGDIVASGSSLASDVPTWYLYEGPLHSSRLPDQ